MNSIRRYSANSAFVATTLVAGNFLYESSTLHDTPSWSPSKSRPRFLESSLLKPSWSRSFSYTLCEEKSIQPTTITHHDKPPSSSRPGTKLLFLGSGSSTGCPKPICALLFQHLRQQQQQQQQQQQHSESNNGLAVEVDAQKLQEINTKWGQDIAEKCKTSMIASIGDPRQNKNYRNNPSLLISHRNQDDGNLCNGDDGDNVDDNDDAGDENHHERNGLKNVIIDVGKTFREGALRWMPRHGIYHIDGIVLTHEHADAIFGLDDLRGFQLAPPPCTKTKSSPGGVTSTREQDNSSMSIPVFLSAKCLKTVKKAFGYLVPKEPTGHAPKDNETKVVRHVASLNFQTVEWFQPFYVAGLKMIPLPVMHGEDFICNGYAFSVKGDKGVTVNVVYLSDISRMIPETEKFILEELPPTDILVVDTLMFRKKHAVHFSLDQALALVKRLKASKTYLVGMNCDDFPEHDVANRLVQERDATVEFAHDGLVIEI